MKRSVCSSGLALTLVASLTVTPAFAAAPVVPASGQAPATPAPGPDPGSVPSAPLGESAAALPIPPAPAEPAAAAGPRLTVILRGGGMIRGEVVEKLPGQHVTLRLSTGEHRRIRWDYIEHLSENDETRPPALAHVYFRSVDARATLQRLSANGRWFDVCRVPCAGKVAGRGLYRVAGDGVIPSEAFRLPSRNGRIGIQTRRVSSTGGRTLGAVLALGGGAVAYVGLLVLSFASVPDNDWDDDPSSVRDDGDEREDAVATGTVMLLGGIGAGVTGLVLLVRGKTLVDVRELGRRPSAEGGVRPSFSVPLGGGFALTERGLAF